MSSSVLRDAVPGLWSFVDCVLDLKTFSKNRARLISQALDESDWVVAHAANYLNMRRTTLVEKMRKYGITRPERA